MLTLCPYTKIPFEQLEKSNREHIIPHALGGPDAFSVTADEATNSRFGAEVDAYLAQNFLCKSIATRLGIKTRSGPAKLRLDTVHDETGAKVVFEFGEDSFGAQFSSPVIKGENGKPTGFVGFQDEASKALAEVNGKRLSRGKAIFSPTDERQISSGVTGSISLDLTLLGAGLLKVAYLSAAYSLGDEFLALEAAQEMLERLSSDAPLVSFSACFPDKDTLLQLGLLPKNLEEKHHFTGWVQPPGMGLMLLVRLFDCDLLTAVYEIKAGVPSLKVGDSKFFMIDTLASTVRDMTWREIRNPL